ncbi:hypothetical protein GCM10010145_13450 [Streptomyces ruber]|uniref:PPM-type phosphatase domain-containing protein n=2 Tax=Streptomyces TaxID=1883 RepID=A0A918BC36_9ACTN|nr:protein phosphatase 2C domain-containing protein [Streptomyces ruber]GGQ46057.1 hypothetical protein GCM10010145_13450 [Streptomyces ruber]
MSHQGERPTGHEDDWWRQLYDDSVDDAGPTAAADSLDDRFASAAGTVGKGAGTPPPPPPPVSDVPPSPGADGTPPAETPGASGVSGAPGVPGQRGPAPYDRSPAPGGQEPADRPPSDGPVPRSAPGAAPWEPPPADPPGPVSFPPGPKPPGYRAEAPRAVRPPTHAPRTSRPPTQPPGAAAPPSRPPADAAPTGFRPPPGSPWSTATPLPDALPPDPRDAPPPDAPQTTATPRPTAPGPAAPTPATPEPAAAQQPPPVPTAPHPSDNATLVTGPRPDSPAHLGSRPPTYDGEPGALPAADPDGLDELVADTVLDGARHGTYTLRAASGRGDSARFRGEPRRDALLTARFGTGEQALVLVAVATGARAVPGAHRAAAEACRWIGRAVGHHHARLVEDIRDARRGDLKSGLHRLTDRSLGRLRVTAAERGLDPDEYTASLRCLLLPADPECRTRVFFGVGAGGLFRLRDDEWQDIEPRAAEGAGAPVLGFGSLPHETADGDRLTMHLGVVPPPSPYSAHHRVGAEGPPREPFRFRASVARPGDTLLLCSAGFADPLRGEPSLAEHLAGRWAGAKPPGLAAFLADTQVRVKGYADDRTAVAVWEA